MPTLCFTLAQRVHLGSPVVPPVDAIGWAACGSRRWELNVFGNRQACKKAGIDGCPYATYTTPALATAISEPSLTLSIACRGSGSSP